MQVKLKIYALILEWNMMICPVKANEIRRGS